MIVEELYHYGVKGMRWGVRRSRNKTKTRPKTKSKKKALDKNEQRVKNIVRARRIAAASKIASKALMSIAQKTYDKYKDNGTPGQAAVVTGSAYASKALNVIGNAAVASSIVQRYQYARDYWKN